MVLEEFEAVLQKMYERRKELLGETGRADCCDGCATSTPEKETASTSPREAAIMISKPHDNDVICGRGYRVNAHPGNILYRSYVSDVKVDYVMSSKKDKPKYAMDIVQKVRNQDPPGRFLKSHYRCHDNGGGIESSEGSIDGDGGGDKNEEDNASRRHSGQHNDSAGRVDRSIYWKDIGEKEALAKTRQALREGAKSISKEIGRKKTSNS